MEFIASRSFTSFLVAVFLYSPFTSLAAQTSTEDDAEDDFCQPFWEKDSLAKPPEQGKVKLSAALEIALQNIAMFPNALQTKEYKFWWILYYS